MTSVLVVDDKDMMRDSVCGTLRRAGFEVASAQDGPSALEIIARKRPDAVVTDLKMPKMTGIQLVEKIQEIDDDLPVVVMTAFGTIQNAVEAMKLGAHDFVTKPFEGDELIIAVKRGIQHAKVKKENAVLKASSSPVRTVAGVSGVGAGLDRLIGESAAMKKVREQVAAIASSHGTVLVTGESGSGKEVVARAIHDLSPRDAGPFLAVNCAALSESLLESELFGHERGAFTGAERLRKGRFELADNGTLLLDEVSEVSPQIQAKLLRVLQERAFERVGSSLTIGVDVRIVATSNRDLPAASAAGEFRSDLYFRLNVLPVHLPPLRERDKDAAILFEHFVALVCQREGREVLRVAGDALDLLTEYHWPGNVRELMNICERAVVLTCASERSAIDRSLIEPWLQKPVTKRPVAQPLHAVGQPAGPQSIVEAKSAAFSGGDSFGYAADHRAIDAGDPPAAREPSQEEQIRPLCDVERELIIGALRHYGGHRQKTAKALGIGVRTLGLKLKKWKAENLVPQTL